MSIVAITVDKILPVWGRNLQQAAIDAMNTMLPIIYDDFQDTVKTWKNKPEFGIRQAAWQGSDLIGGVGTSDEIYGYVNEGTRPHDIYPVRAKKLRFLSTYKAKTQPGVIGSSSGGASGDPVFAQMVHHPGTQGRHFEKLIIAKRQPEIQALMNKFTQQARGR